MIVRPRPTLFTLFFILRGSIVPRILPRLVLVCGLSALIVLLHRHFPVTVPAFDGTPYALLGIALSVFLSFRNSACYDRWWEGRRIWGQLVIASRAFARQTLLLDPADRRRALTLTMAFARAMVRHLRPDTGADPRALLPPDLRDGFTTSRDRPDFLLRIVAADLVAIRRAGAISDIDWQALEGSLREMSQMQVNCDRILNTPVPFGYTLLLHRTAFVFCLLLPFGFVDMLGWGTPLASTLIAYAFFGLDALGDELERPFDMAPNALPIGTLATLIEINLREALGETDLPPSPLPVDYLLM